MYIKYKKKKKVYSIRLNFIQNTLYMVFTDGAEDRFNLFQVDVYLWAGLFGIHTQPQQNIPHIQHCQVQYQCGNVHLHHDD